MMCRICAFECSRRLVFRQHFKDNHKKIWKQMKHIVKVGNKYTTRRVPINYFKINSINDLNKSKLKLKPETIVTRVGSK